MTDHARNAAARLDFLRFDPWTNPPNRPIPTSGPTPGSDYARRLDAVNDLAREVEPPEPTDDSALYERRHLDRVGDVFGRSA